MTRPRDGVVDGDGDARPCNVQAVRAARLNEVAARGAGPGAAFPLTRATVAQSPGRHTLAERVADRDAFVVGWAPSTCAVIEAMIRAASPAARGERARPAHLVPRA